MRASRSQKVCSDETSEAGSLSPPSTAAPSTAATSRRPGAKPGSSRRPTRNTPLSPLSPRTPRSSSKWQFEDFEADCIPGLDTEAIDTRTSTREARTSTHEANDLDVALADGDTDPTSDRDTDQEDENAEMINRNFTLGRRIFQLARKLFTDDKPCGLKGKAARRALLKHAFRTVLRASRTMHRLNDVITNLRHEIRERQLAAKLAEEQRIREQWKQQMAWLQEVADKFNKDSAAKIDNFNKTLSLDDGDDVDDGSDMEKMVKDMLRMAEEGDPTLHARAKKLEHSYEEMQKELASLLRHSLHTLEEGEDLLNEMNETSAAVREMLAKFMIEVEQVKSLANAQTAELQRRCEREMARNESERASMMSADGVHESSAKVAKLAAMTEFVKMADAVTSGVSDIIANEGKVKSRPNSDVMFDEGKSRSGCESSRESPGSKSSKERVGSVHASAAASEADCPGGEDSKRAKLSQQPRYRPLKRYGVECLPRPRSLRHQTFQDRSDLDDISLREAVSHMWWRSSTYGSKFNLKNKIDRRGKDRLPPLSTEVDVQAQSGTFLRTCTPRKISLQPQWESQLSEVKQQRLANACWRAPSPQSPPGRKRPTLSPLRLALMLT